MHTLLILLLTVGLALPLRAQDEDPAARIDRLEDEIQELRVEKEEARRRIRRIENRVDSLKEVKQKLARDTASERPVYGCVFDRASVYSEPSIDGEVLHTVSVGETVEIIDAGGSLLGKPSWEVLYEGQVGYVQRTRVHSEEAWNRYTDGKPLGFRTPGECEVNEEGVGNTRWVSKFTINVRSGPSGADKIRDQLEQGEKVEVTKADGNWCQVEYDFSRTGWIYCDLLSDSQVDKLSESERSQVRRRSFVKKNAQLSERAQDAILEGKIYPGMTKEMVRASWGEPDDVNRTVTRNRTKEQWVYEGYEDRDYVYFRNGELTTIQN